jgi:DNA-3-methyladenine glycosylase
MTKELEQVLALDAIVAAPLLVGSELYVRGVGGRLVEVEAYDEGDPASHCYGGPRGRNLPMFLPGGHIYVYRSYGIHWCMNIVTGQEGSGQAVLLRALEPLRGIESMRANRGDVPDRKLASGPGNLTKALGVSNHENGARLGKEISLNLSSDKVRVVAAKRIGISVAIEEKRRFFEYANPSVSHASKI